MLMGNVEWWKKHRVSSQPDVGSSASLASRFRQSTMGVRTSVSSMSDGLQQPLHKEGVRWQLNEMKLLTYGSLSCSPFHCQSELRPNDPTNNPGQTLTGPKRACQEGRPEAAEVVAFAPFFQFSEECLPVQ